MMFNLIRSDFRRHCPAPENLRLWSKLNVWCTPGLQAIVVHRMGCWLRYRAQWFKWVLALPLYPMYFVLLAYVRLAWDIRIESSCEIGPGLYIGHFGGILLRRCRLGAHCSIQQQVHLEPLDTEKSYGNGPVIGNKVWIGAHSKIFGEVKVGDGATIGAGALVSQEVPASCLLLGRPARIVQKNHDNSHYL